MEGLDCRLHSLAKQGVENDFPEAVEAIADSIAKYELHNLSCQLHWTLNRDELAILYAKYDSSSNNEDYKTKYNGKETGDIFFWRRFNNLHRKSVAKKKTRISHLTCFNFSHKNNLERPNDTYAVGDPFANIEGPFEEELQEQQAFLR